MNSPDYLANKYEFGEGVAEYKRDLYFTHADWNDPIFLGCTDGRFRLPALRWEQTFTLSELTENLARWKTLLALLPFTYATSSDDRQYLERELTVAFANVASGGAASQLAQRYSTVIANDISWFTEANGGWRCDGTYAMRNANECFTLSGIEFERIDRAFRELLEIAMSQTVERRSRACPDGKSTHAAH